MIGSEKGRAQPARVLIIDDDELTTATFAQMLRLEGHEVRTAQNAKTALDEATDVPPDAIIVDLHMPVMDGLTFIGVTLCFKPLWLEDLVKLAF
jgi:PleD family two-component response regulator